MTLVVASEPVVVSDAAPAAVETYGDERRESYLNRSDCLTFRVSDGTLEHRFFGNGRPDAVKEVVENAGAGSLDVVFGMRPDHCVKHLAGRDATTGVFTYETHFNGRTDGVKSLHIALRASTDAKTAAIDVGADSATSLYREKIHHMAVKFDPDAAPHRLIEAYQDFAAGTLRIVAEADELGHRATVTFNVAVPNDDDQYERARVIMMGLVQHLLVLKRDLYINLAPFVPGDDNHAMLAKQNARLVALSASLFSAFDEVSGPGQASA